MAGQKISQLPPVTSALTTDFFPVVQGGVTSKETLAQVITLLQTALLTPSNGGIVYTNSTSLQVLAGTATANQTLLSGSNSAPAWSTATYPATTTINQLLYSSANNTITGLATSAAAVLTTSSSVPTWASQLSLALGGTNANLTASNGGIFYSTASAAAILAGTSTANQVLLSGSSSAPAWSTATFPATTTINQILYSSSANTVAGLATANNGVLITSGVGVPSISSTLPSAVQLNITQLGTVLGTINLNTSGSGTTTIGSSSSPIRGSIWVDTGISTNNVGLSQSVFSNLTSGVNNTGLGNLALFFVTSGSNNAAVGNSALRLITTGSGNTAIGSQAGQTITTGSNNTCLGIQADVSSGNSQQRISIGNGVTNSNDNTCVIGYNGLTSIINASTTGGCSLGTTANPFGTMVLGSSSTSNVTISPASQAAARTYTIGDAGGAAQFIMSAYGSAQSISSILNITNSTSASSTTTGALVVTGGVGVGGSIYCPNLFATSSTNQLLLGPASNTTISSPTPASPRTYTIQDAGQNANFVLNLTTDVTGTTQTIIANSTYIADNASQVTFTLPATANVGDTFTIWGKGAGGFKIAQNAGQLIHVGNLVTTTGTSGSIQSTGQWDSVEVICVTANTTFSAMYFGTANIT